MKQLFCLFSSMLLVLNGCTPARMAIDPSLATGAHRMTLSLARNGFAGEMSGTDFEVKSTDRLEGASLGLGVPVGYTISRSGSLWNCLLISDRSAMTLLIPGTSHTAACQTFVHS